MITIGWDDFNERFGIPHFHVDDKVTATGGPFESFDGTVVDVDFAKSLATVEINVFGRPTPVSIRFHDLKKQET